MVLRPLVLTLSLVAVLFAGCIGSDPDTDAPGGPGGDPAPNVYDRLMLDMATLPCERAYTHGETSAIFREITHIEGGDDIRYGEVDAIDGTDLVLFSRYGGGGFDLYNVSNPYEPQLVVGFPIAESYSLDIKASTDGRTVYSGGFGAITIVDLSDPDVPSITRTVAFPDPFPQLQAQAHMLHVANISGTDYVFAATQFGEGVLIFKAVGAPGDVDLEFVTVFAPGIGGPIAAHDMMVYHDPVEEKPILWVANGLGGFIAADVSDPSLPIVVSYDPEADPYQGYTHTISVTHYGDKRYAVTMAEIGAMALKVYDVTVMAAPVLLATWTIEDVPLSTQHNTQILGEWMWLGHYGEGVLFFNLKEEIDSMLLPAYNIGLVTGQTGAAMEPYGQYIPPSGSTWESIVIDGVHWTTSGSGIYGTLNGCLEAGNETLDAYV